MLPVLLLQRDCSSQAEYLEDLPVILQSKMYSREHMPVSTVKSTGSACRRHHFGNPIGGWRRVTVSMQTIKHTRQRVVQYGKLNQHPTLLCIREEIVRTLQGRYYNAYDPCRIRQLALDKQTRCISSCAHATSDIHRSLATLTRHSIHCLSACMSCLL